jgi:hypothetical protein
MMAALARVLRRSKPGKGVLATRFIIRIAFGIVRLTFGNFVVFHIIGLVRVNLAFRLSLPRPSHEIRRTCLSIFAEEWAQPEPDMSRLKALDEKYGLHSM